jgi:ubiquinone/menaquinone biosynthesis C-methylase UbiE
MPVITLGPRKRSRGGQCQKPRGLLGKFVLWSMNRRHSRVTDWGLAQISIREGDTILDVGCGGGRTLSKLAAAAPHGRIFGIDHSEAAIATAALINEAFIAQGRVVVQQGSVASLPFPDNAFDLVTAVETHFWWGDIGAGMGEIFRTLKPGGHLAIVAEFYNGGRYAKHAGVIRQMTSMAVLDVEQHRGLFVDRGFTDVRIVEDGRKGWICAIGTKISPCQRE